MNQSERRVIDRSEAAARPPQQSTVIQPKDARRAHACSARTHTQCPSTESALWAMEDYKRRRTDQLDHNMIREHTEIFDGLSSSSGVFDYRNSTTSGVEFDETDQENSNYDGFQEMARTKQTDCKPKEGFTCHVCQKVYRQHFGRKRHLGVKHRVDEQNNPITEDEYQRLLSYNARRRRTPTTTPAPEAATTMTSVAVEIGAAEIAAAVASISPPPVASSSQPPAKRIKSAEFVPSDYDSDTDSSSIHSAPSVGQPESGRTPLTKLPTVEEDLAITDEEFADVEPDSDVEIVTPLPTTD